ncbi:hypothetical protein N7G274_004121 [Stereocaulon virgatum]|uniref:Uncharacterized protein n=1 Tax=Stereocaulon virgatum TaxID=373712 RepID=A0ABR4AB14_9LECA
MSAQTDGAAGSHDQLLAEVISWRTAFMNIPGTAAQKAAVGKAAIDELKKWHTAFNSYRGTIEQKVAANEEVQLNLNDWTLERTGPPRSEAELSGQLKNLQDKFDSSAAYAKRLQEEVKSHEAEDARQKNDLQQLLDINSRISSSLKREQVAREILIGAFVQYKKATALGSDCEALSTGMGATPSMWDPEGRSSQEEDAPPVAQLDKATGPECSNKRKRDTPEVDSQPNDVFQPRKRMDFSDQKMLGREGSRRTDASQPDVQVSRDRAALWRAPALKDASTGQHLLTRNMEISNTTLRFPAVPNPAPVPVILRSALAASPDVEATSRDVGDAEALTQVRQLGSSITVPTPGMVFPVEKKWKHSMLRRG